MKKTWKILIYILFLLFPVYIQARDLEATIEESIFFLIEIIGGLAIFLYGIKSIDDGLKKLFENKLRKIISFVTRNKWLSVFVGIAVTFILQSGSATVYMLVGFANASLLTLHQALGLVLGAGIGNTLFVQIFSFNILKYSAFILTLGFFILFLSRNKRSVYFGQIIFGLGLAFFGMKVISQNTGFLGNFTQFEEILKLFIHKPFYGIVIAAIFTTLLHSSTAIIGIFIALSFENPSINLFKAAIPIVIGANIGSSLVVFMYGVQKYKPEGRRVAVANVLIKIAGACLFFPFINQWALFINMIEPNVARSIANFHTFFNISLTVLILPFTHIIENLSNKFIPDIIEPYAEEKPLYLNESVLETPDLAIGQAFRETLRMAGYTQKMLHDSQVVFDTDNEDMMEQIIKKDDIIDNLQKDIINYLTQISAKTLSDEQANQEVSLVSIVNGLENIGDIVVKNLMSIASKKIKGGLRFSTDGAKELREIHTKVINFLESLIDAIATDNKKLAEEIIKHKTDVVFMDNNFRMDHFRRLQEGLKESIETSSIHLDYLSNMVSINNIIVNIAYTLAKNGKQ
ncbi:MAG: Na/Pi cotransporter family protein [Candidatus Firestonebacteria bacterium]|nr:Na/Pi cotransporter family protein [Candidatus Firestonebacteria bacterium]